jgi:hypothetical protein
MKRTILLPLLVTICFSLACARANTLHVTAVDSHHGMITGTLNGRQYTFFACGTHDPSSAWDNTNVCANDETWLKHSINGEDIGKSYPAKVISRSVIQIDRLVKYRVESVSE